jgi:hypothetical protein
MSKNRLYTVTPQRIMDSYNECVKEKAMDLSIERALTALQPGQPLRLEGRRLSVVRGAVWVTQEGDPRDPVLKAGDDLVFDQGAAIAQALDGPALVALEERAPEPNGLRGVFHRLRHGWV